MGSVVLLCESIVRTEQIDVPRSNAAFGAVVVALEFLSFVMVLLTGVFEIVQWGKSLL